MTVATRPTTPVAARLSPARDPSRPLALAAFATVVSLGMLAPSLMPTAKAATSIQRCIGADGTPIYTDKPCRLLDAQRAPMSGELLSRIAREQASGAAIGDIKGTLATAPTVARRSAASGCARTATQLTMDLQGSWALGDVNRLAESYHWAGIEHRRAQRIMKQLERLASQPLLQAEYFDATIGGGGMQLADATGDRAGPAGVLQLTLSGAGMQDFDVERYRGCYFIRF